MTIHQTLKAWSSWDGIFVPALGEIVIDTHNNKLKIGDGKTNFADLPYIDGNPPEMSLSEKAKEFIENNIEYLDVNDYETFYSHITTVELAREVSKALFKAGLNPKEHLKECPIGCESIFYYEGKEDTDTTIKNGSGTTISYPIKGKANAQYQWIPKAHNTGKHWDEYICDYDVNKRRKDNTKRPYFEPWTLEEDE